MLFLNPGLPVRIGFHRHLRVLLQDLQNFLGLFLRKGLAKQPFPCGCVRRGRPVGNHRVADLGHLGQHVLQKRQGAPAADGQLHPPLRRPAQRLPGALRHRHVVVVQQGAVQIHRNQSYQP